MACHVRLPSQSCHTTQRHHGARSSTAIRRGAGGRKGTGPGTGAGPHRPGGRQHAKGLNEKKQKSGKWEESQLLEVSDVSFCICKCYEMYISMLIFFNLQMIETDVVGICKSQNGDQLPHLPSCAAAGQQECQGCPGTKNHGRLNGSSTVDSTRAPRCVKDNMKTRLIVWALFDKTLIWLKANCAPINPSIRCSFEYHIEESVRNSQNKSDPCPFVGETSALVGTSSFI